MTSEKILLTFTWYTNQMGKVLQHNAVQIEQGIYLYIDRFYTWKTAGSIIMPENSSQAWEIRFVCE